VPLDPNLEKVADGGMVLIDGCYFLCDQANGQTNVTIKDFQDRTGYECFINHIHVDDYVSGDLVNQSIGYACRVFEKWNEQKFDGEFIAVIAFTTNEDTNEDEATVRFHYRRKAESWLADDLDGYNDEGVLEISSADVEFFRLFSTAM